jgi:hypothetical protein
MSSSHYLSTLRPYDMMPKFCRIFDTLNLIGLLVPLSSDRLNVRREIFSRVNKVINFLAVETATCAISLLNTARCRGPLARKTIVQGAESLRDSKPAITESDTI